MTPEIGSVTVGKGVRVGYLTQDPKFRSSQHNSG